MLLLAVEVIMKYFLEYLTSEIEVIDFGDDTGDKTTYVSSNSLDRIFSLSHLAELYLGLKKSKFLTDQGLLKILEICGETLNI